MHSWSVTNCISKVGWKSKLHPTPQPRTHTARLVAGPTDVSVKCGIVPRGNYSREDFTWVVPRVIHRTILHYKNLESLKGTFYTTALHVKHLSAEHCIAALIAMGKFYTTWVLHLYWGVYSCKSLPIMMHYLYGNMMYSFCAEVGCVRVCY